mgnify:CR=1 FL=1
MAGSVNKVILIGNLGRDPEVRFSQAGAKIVNLSVATSESWKDKQTGERKEKTEWHRAVIFNEHLAGIAEQYLRKGSKIFLRGSLQTRKWTDKDGNEKYTTEVILASYRGTIVMLGDGEKRSDRSDTNDDYQRPLDTTNQKRPAATATGDDDDTIPF